MDVPRDAKYKHFMGGEKEAFNQSNIDANKKGLDCSKKYKNVTVKSYGTVSLSQILERSVFSSSFVPRNKGYKTFTFNRAQMPSKDVVKSCDNMGNGTSHTSHNVKLSPDTENSKSLTNGINNSNHKKSLTQAFSSTFKSSFFNGHNGSKSSSDSSTSSGSSTHTQVPKTSPKPLVVAAFPEDYSALKETVPRLQKEIGDKDRRLDYLNEECSALRRQLKKKNEELSKFQQEVHKLKSVLQLKTSPNHDRRDAANQLNCVSDEKSVSAKKQGVSAQSFPSKTSDKILVSYIEKDFQTKQLIREAILDNDFLKHLDHGQVREIVDSMYSETFPEDASVIKEGSTGSHLFVLADGDLEVQKDGKVLGKITPGKAFGELALLYNCTRTASVRAVTKSRVWVIERTCFQQIMMRQGIQRLEDNVKFLSSVPIFKDIKSEHLTKIADSLEVDSFASGTYIIRQGTSGDTFYIIRSGNVKVTQKVKGKREDQLVRTLQRGDFFGEQALLKDECRSANIIAASPGVECLTLDRNSFTQLMGDLTALRSRDYGDEKRGALQKHKHPHDVNTEQEFAHIRLSDLEVVTTLGVGGFGRVELVQNSSNKTETFALKCLKKNHIVETQQQEHIYSEKKIMMSVRSPFICRLYKTFRDSKYVYMLMEACLGGEVWSILRDRGWFDDHTGRFISACVLEALDYLHSNNIIYRDLKPENLLLDPRGYVKLVDFGFSKEMTSNKTWTFCGTPEYVAPEIILNKGHDRAVDYWAVGVLMFELLAGTPPFTGSNPIKTYNIILRGMDVLEFPAHISRHATSLIRRLCKEHPSERLGYQRGGVLDIKNHRWFLGFDWDSLSNQKMKAPIIPKIRSAIDASNFDAYARDTEVPPDEVSGWDLEF